jgi:prepilin-type N-terminal cleavage/methylation domain-containing protein
MKTKKGFTLLELLIVVGILAILSTTVVLVINPAQLLKKARDSQRITDLNTVTTAIAYYITDVVDADVGDTDKTYSDVADVVCTLGGGSRAADANQGVFTTDSNGWIPINFGNITGGSPIGSLPHDPAVEVSTGNHYYVYGVLSATNLTFKLITNMESTYYSGDSGTGDVESTDGGTMDTLYEVGTGMSLTVTSTEHCFNDAGV